MADVTELLRSLDPGEPAADPVAGVRRALRRRARRRAVTGVLAAVVVLAGAGGAVARVLRPAPDVLVPASAPPVPSSAATPSPVSTTAAPPVAVVPFVAYPDPPFAGDRFLTEVAAPTCTFTQLVLTARLVPDRTPDLVLQLRNASTSTCQVQARGEVLVRDAGGTLARGSLSSMRSNLRPLASAIPPGGTELLAVYVVLGCGSDAPTSVTITNPDQGLLVTGPVDTACGPAAEGGRHPVIGSPVVLDAQGRDVDDATMSVETSLVSVPARVQAGQPLRFGVVLTNRTSGAISLHAHCPIYAVTLRDQVGEPALFGALNCPQAPTEVRPGRSVEFRLEVTAPAIPGSAELTYVREDVYGDQPVSAAFVVRP